MKKLNKITLELYKEDREDNEECKNNKLKVMLLIDDEEQYIELEDLPAAACFGLVKEIIYTCSRKVDEHNEL